MQSALTFGLAKNVNPRPAVGARRVASAYHLGGGRLPASHSSSALAALGGNGPTDPMTSPASATALEDLSCAGLMALGGGAAGRVLGASATALSPSSSSSSLCSLASSDAGGPTPGPLVPHDDAAGDHDRHVSERASAVDKTNPFIGYFQAKTSASRGGPRPRTGGAPGPSTSTSAFQHGLKSSYQFSFFGKQKKLTEWIGQQSNRLPSFFSASTSQQSSARPPRAAAKSTVEEGPLPLADDERIKETALRNNYRALASTMDDGDDDDAGTKKPRASRRKLPDGLGGSVPSGPPPRTRSQSSTFSTVSSAGSSRFEQDFDVIGTLGQGGQGMVYKVRSRVDGCLYAVKKVTLSRSLQRDATTLNQALREVKAMASMSPHANVVRYHTAWLEEEVVEETAETEMDGGGKNRGTANQRMSSMADAEISSASSVSASSFFSRNEYSVASFSQYEGSMDGFEFAEPSQSIIAEAEQELLRTKSEPTLLDAVEEDVQEDQSDVSSQPETTLVLFIQMELCGASQAVPVATDASDSDEEERNSFERLIHRLTTKPKARAPSPRMAQERAADTVHSTLTAWLRATVDARGDPSEAGEVVHREGLRLFQNVVQGVQHMHSMGVIHRDLKPDNIFLHGEIAKIGDFGLSKSLFPDAHESTQPRGPTWHTNEDHTTALGTFTYASPEQLGYNWNNAKGKVSQIVKSAKYSYKSDIFALGVILLELCYPCSTMMERSQVLTAVRHGVVPQIALQRFPAEMNLVLRMTSLDPNERPSSDEVCEQLRAMLTAKEAVTVQSALDELRDLQAKLAVAVHQLRDRSQVTQQLELLVSELNDKVQNVGLALA